MFPDAANVFPTLTDKAKIHKNNLCLKCKLLNTGILFIESFFQRNEGVRVPCTRLQVITVMPFEPTAYVNIFYIFKKISTYQLMNPTDTNLI